MRRRPIRNGDAASTRDLPADWGLRPEPFWPWAIAAAHDKRPDFSSWPRSVGTSSGRCSSKVSTIAPTSASTTTYVRASWAATTCAPGSIIRTSLRAFLRTTASRAPSANSTGEAGGPPRVTTVSESKAAGGSNWLNARSRALHIFRAPRLVVGGIDPALSTEALLCSGGLNPRASALSVSACPTNLPPISTSTGRGFSPGRWRAWPPPQSLRRSPDCG